MFVMQHLKTAKYLLATFLPTGSSVASAAAATSFVASP